jgi:hypothetical protein
MRHPAVILGLLAACRIGAAIPVVEGDVSAETLLQWVKEQKQISANLKIPVSGTSSGFCMKCSDENSKYTGEKMTVPLWQVGTTTSGATFFEADQDVDCDGSHDGPCNVSKDPSHQPDLSCGCNANAGKLPFFVLPLGTRFNASARGIKLGQVGVGIYVDPATKKVGMMYAPWLDEDGVQQEVGESSAYMAQQMGVDPNPETGGSDTGNTWIVFPGSANMLSGADRLDHAKALSVGLAAVHQLLKDFPLKATRTLAPLRESNLVRAYSVRTGSMHVVPGEAVSIFNLSGKNLATAQGRVLDLGAGAYVIKPSAR